MLWYRADPGAPPSYEGAELEGAAPGFSLTNQKGVDVSLADFRGKVVVLTLLDPDCTDICPIYAYQYRLAYQALGSDAAKVAFLAFNANDQKTTVEDVMAATRKWATGEMPNWHFLTGSPEELHAVWRAYGLMASGAPKADRPGEKQHSPAIYVIDQAGQRRWFFSTNFEGAPPASALIVKHAEALLAEERTAPKQPRPGALHVEVQLIDPETLSYVERASVTGVAALHGGRGRAGAVRSRYRKPWHEIDLTLDKPGAWDIELAVDGPRPGGNTSFRVEVLPEEEK